MPVYLAGRRYHGSLITRSFSLLPLSLLPGGFFILSSVFRLLTSSSPSLFRWLDGDDQSLGGELFLV